MIFLLGFYTMRYFFIQDKLFSNAHGLLNPEMSLPFELPKWTNITQLYWNVKWTKQQNFKHQMFQTIVGCWGIHGSNLDEKLLLSGKKRTHSIWSINLSLLTCWKDHVRKPCKPVFLYHYSHCCRVELLKVKLNWSKLINAFISIA